ncbi:GIY-YIG nuclease family protein [Dysosmobacter sp.]|uniref:GIY-YIG nuclease family protein n=1 Tax=Dysosmobacter sp. TaxID=2591382 RepID=UPI00261B3679|nr:GIY-YIG nuclease family protein [uncultured Oscillibacter sp.]
MKISGGGATQMDELYLNDLLRFSREEMERVKVRFNLQPKGGQDPMELYLENREKVNTEWLLAKKKKGFFQEGEIAIALVRLDDQGRWLLTTIKRITKALDVVSETGAIAYEASELEQYAPYFGRTVVRYHKTGQAPLWRYKKIHEKLVVDEILPAVYTGEGFPGYDQVRLSWQKLKRIAEQRPADWINALENQKAVYLITDTSNGKLYVGSATSRNRMLMVRWESYVKTLHGGNKKLRRIVEEKGEDHIKNYFQYSILENYNAKVSDDFVLKREAWWKEVLQSRTYGYNDN